MSETDTKPVDPASVTPALPAVPDVPGSEAVGAGSAVVLNGVVYEEEDMTDSDASDDGSEYTDGEEEEEETDDEDENQMKGIINSVRDFLNPINAYENITGKKVNMTAFTDVTDKMTDKLFDVTDLMADKLVVGIDKGLDVAAAVSDKTKELFTSTPSAAADATSENPEHTTHPAHAQSTPETLVPTDSIQPAHVAVEISTGAPSDAAPVAVLADKDLQPLRKKRTSVVGGEKPHRHRRSSTLVSADGSVPSGEHKKKRKKKVELQDTSRVGQLLSKFTPIVSRVTGAINPIITENLGSVSYDNSHNNFWGCTFSCLDDRRLFCSCVLHDEVRASSWLLVLCALLFLALFIFLDGLLKGYTHDTIRNHPHFLALMISLPFTIVCSILAATQVYNHNHHMKHRASQTQIIRIVLMVPIYAWASWFSLWFLEYAVYLDFVRVCYEAFVIYSFLVLLTKYLGGNTAVLKVLRSLPQQTWPSPLCCLPKVMPNKKFYTSLLYGTLQYSVIMPLVAFVAGALNWLDLYGEGEIDWHYAYPYVALIQNFCQLAALYCLVWFWVATARDLQPFKPTAKFLVVKSVVFFTFWQSIGLAMAGSYGWIPHVGGFEVGEVQVAIQNFLIVIEMFIVAILHKYVFSHVEYQDGSLMIIMNARKAAWKEAENPNSYAQAAQAMKVKQDLLNIKEQANEVVAEIKLSVDQAVLNAGESVIDNTTPEQKLALLALSMQANDALAVVDDKLVTLQQAVSAELMKKDSERFLNEEDDDILLLDDDDEVTPDGDHQHHESKQSAPTFAPDLDDIVRSQAVYFNATPAANKEQDKEIPDAFSFDDDTPATPVVVKPMFSRSPTSVNGKRGAEKSDVAKVESEKSDLEKSDQKSDASSFVAETRAIVAALAPSAVVASVTEAAKSVTSPIKHAVVNPASRGVSFANVPSNVSLSTLPPSPTIKPVTVEMSVDSSVNVSTTEKSKQERLEAARSAALATKQRILAEKAAAAAAKQ